MDFDKTANALISVQKRIGNKILWPKVDYRSMDIYFPFLLKEIIDSKYDCLKNEEIKSPSIFWKLISFTISTFRANPLRWNKDEIIKTCEALFEEAKSRKLDDFYFEQQTNRLKHFTNVVPKSTNTNKRLISELKSSLWMFEEAAYYQFHDFGGVVHGPYTNDCLTVNYSYDMRVSKIWPELRSELNEIEIICKYPKDLIKIEFDCFNNYSGKGFQEFDSALVLIDENQEKNENNIRKILDQITCSAQALFSKTNEMTQFEVLKKEAEIAFKLIGRKVSEKTIEQMINEEVIINKYNTTKFDYFNILKELNPPVKTIKFKPNFTNR
jgi:hypothetical protein